MRDREREKRERQRQMAPRMTRTERTWASPVGWLKGDPEEPPPPTSQDHTEKKGTRGLLNASSSQDLEDKKLPKLPEQWKDAALVVVLDFLGRYGYKSAALALEGEALFTAAGCDAEYRSFQDGTGGPPRTTLFGL